MLRVPHIPECRLAECTIAVAESRSVEALGAACGRAIGQITGSSAFGLYWLDGDAPRLFAGGGIPDGFDDDYRSGLGRCDPLIDSILSRGRVVDGRSLLGAYCWPRSTTYDLLRTWGFNNDMCGPLRLEDRIAGVFYTGTPDGYAPYTSAHRQRMDLLCRAGSLALTNLAKSGIVDARTGPRPGGHALSGVAPSPCEQFTAARPRGRALDLPRPLEQGDRAVARDLGRDGQGSRRQPLPASRRLEPHRARGAAAKRDCAAIGAVTRRRLRPSFEAQRTQERSPRTSG